MPFVDRAARYLSGDDRLGGARMVDSFVQLRTAESGTGGAGVEVIDPAGKTAAVANRSGHRAVLFNSRERFLSVAVCEWKDAMVGVNPDRRESDLAVIQRMR